MLYKTNFNRAALNLIIKRSFLTEGEFVFVALDDFRKPIAVDRD